MAEKWTYFVPCVIQVDGRTAFYSRILETDHALNSAESVRRMIAAIREQLGLPSPAEGEPSPVMPLGWTLITAQRGAAVGVRDNGKKKPG